MTAAILDLCPARVPARVPSERAATDLVRLFSLDRLPTGGRLACHWHRDASGRLACIWESDIGLVS